MEKPPRIRTIALCVFMRDRKILVAQSHDSINGETFYRPLGGGIEFGERGAETVVREIAEEIGAEARAPQYLFTLENIFVYEGEPSHEIALIYDGALADEELYSRPVIEGIEANGEPILAYWKSPAEFGENQLTLYPEGLLEKLRSLLEQ